MGNLIPNQALIYERVNEVVFARYRDPPHNKIPRWVIGGDAKGVAMVQGDLFDYSEWQEIVELSKTNITLRSYIDKIYTTYCLIKEADTNE